MGSVADRLADRIRRTGPLPFAAVMEEALYGPDGYYTRERLAIGPEGDFVTGSSLSPLFGRTTARLVARVAAELGGRGDYLEVGYGAGQHLEAVAGRLGAGGVRLRAWDRVVRPVPAGVERLGGLEEVASAAVSGVVFSYELFDALPVHRLVGLGDGRAGELRVAWSESEGFRYLPGELSDPGLAELLGGGVLERGQVADLAPGWRPLYRRLASSLERGLLVTCDYGYERPALLDRRVRRHGTLACHRDQRVHRDALAGLGEQDLTAHVDWTSLIEEGEAAGLETVALTRQARWLLAVGLFDELAGEESGAGDARSDRVLAGEGGGAGETRSAARMLVDGEGMGEEIRVLVQARGIRWQRVLDPDLLGGAPAGTAGGSTTRPGDVAGRPSSP